MRNAVLFLVVSLSLTVLGQSESGENISPTWEECIGFYRNLATTHNAAELIEIGYDDNGSPIHMFIISAGTGFTPKEIRNQGKGMLLINNAIHPGEPEGNEGRWCHPWPVLTEHR